MLSRVQIASIAFLALMSAARAEDAAPAPLPTMPPAIQRVNNWGLPEEPRTVLPAMVEPIEAESPFFTHANFAARAVFSWGISDRQHSGGIGALFVSPISDLRWKNLVSEAVEFNASTVIRGKLVLSADVGVGSITGGELRDQDFLLSGRRGLFSESLSPTFSDDLFYVMGDAGWRLYEDDECYFDGLVGYMYWRERYVANGGALSVGTPPITAPPGTTLPPGPGITEVFEWEGFRIGGQGACAITSRLAFTSKVMLMPVVHFRNEDTHHNRPDFRQDPSGIDSAVGGFGVMADFGLTYRIYRGLYADLGYRIWNVSVGNGETEIRFSNGNVVQVPLKQADTTRQGLIVGLNYRW
ncbi:MAG: hypothetical protein U0791_10955 [Gemmataceae bacterium]